MQRISFPTNASKSSQNRVLTLILVRSKSCFSHKVPSLPRRSKSKSKTTSRILKFWISAVTSKKDLPPVLTVKICPQIPNARKDSSSFLPSTTMVLPFAEASVSFDRICWIFSCFSLNFIDKAVTV